MSGRYGPITLHDEIRAILEQQGNRWMTTKEVAAEINRRDRYRKGDGSSVEAFQVHGRTKNYPRLFERDGTRVRLHDRQTVAATTEPVSVEPVSSRSTPITAPARVVREAMITLCGPGIEADRFASTLPARPGLYAFHGDAAAWDELGLGKPPDTRPLYVGKSESSLLTRDLAAHLGDGRTGSSTLRRSLAALLRDALGLRGMPRNPTKPGYFSNYGLSAEHDALLTSWMRQHLHIAAWPSPSSVHLATVEAELLRRLSPPLNLQGVVTPWSTMVSGRRAILAQEARDWRPSGDKQGARADLD